MGSVLRYLAGGLVPRHLVGSSHWPWQTFAVNIAGAFTIGVLVVAAARLGWPSWWRPLLAVGLLGGFTTFSTFSVEVVERALAGHGALAAAYAVGSLVAGVTGCALGIAVARSL